MGLSITGYARHRGVSQPAVSKAVKVGRITLLPDGTIDPELADKQWAGSLSVVKSTKDAESPKKYKAASVEVLDSDVTAEAIADMVIPDGLMLTEIKAIHETIKARQSYLNLMKERGELTDLAIVNKRLFELSRELRDSWLNWVNQVSGILAAKLQVDQHMLTIALEHEVSAHLTEIAKSDLKIIL